MRWLVPMLGAAALAIGTPAHASAASKGARAAAAAPASTAVQALPAASAVAPLLAGLDVYRFAIESRDPRVRRYFDQGMLLAFGFNPEEAARSFEAALAIDPACASCWWALAWALGPTINADMSAQAAVRVDRAVAEARRHAHRATPTRRALIEALALRHPRSGHHRRSRLRAAPAQAGATPPGRRRGGAAGGRGAAQPAPLRLVVGRRHAPAMDARDRRPAGAVDGARSSPARRAPLLDPPAGVLAAPAARPAQRRFPAQRGARLGPPAAHAGAHRPARRPLRRRRSRPISARSRPTGATWPRWMRRVPTAWATWRTTTTSCGPRRRWPAARQLALQAAQAAWPAACGPERPRPGQRHRAAVRRAAVLHAGALRRLDHAAARHAAARFGPALPVGDLALRPRHGTAHAAASPNWRSRIWRSSQRLAADPALAALKLKNINPAAPAAAHRRAHAARRSGAGARQAAGRGGAAARGHAIEDAFEYDEPHLWLAPTRHALGAALLAAGQAGPGRAGLSPGPAPLPGQRLVAQRAGVCAWPRRARRRRRTKPRRRPGPLSARAHACRQPRASERPQGRAAPSPPPRGFKQSGKATSS